MKLRKYTESQLREAVKASLSIRQTLEKLGLAPAGGNYNTFNRAVKLFGIDVSHFTGQGWSKGKKLERNKRPIEDFIIHGAYIQPYKLKNRLLQEGIFEPICMTCKRTEWMGKKIPLELHHIEDPNDNRLENLKLLCPNCHALTDNYRGRAKKKR